MKSVFVLHVAYYLLQVCVY